MQEKVKALSEAQRRAHWKYCEELADALNAAGIDQKMFIDHLKGWEIPITKDFLHLIWKLKQGKMFPTDGEVSTTKLTSDQVSQVYDAINFFTSTQWGVGTPFPSIDNEPTP